MMSAAYNWTPELLAAVIEANTAGVTQKDIAIAMGCTDSMIKRRLHAAGTAARRLCGWASILQRPENYDALIAGLMRVAEAHVRPELDPKPTLEQPDPNEPGAYLSRPLVSAIYAAYREGMPMRAMSRVLQIDERHISAVVRRILKVHRLPSPRFSEADRIAAAKKHAEILRSVAKSGAFSGGASPVPTVLRNGADVAPVQRQSRRADDFGIRSRVGLGGVSVPHIPSIDGPYVPRAYDTPSPSPGEPHV